VSPTRYAYWSGSWVEIGGSGGTVSDQYPGSVLADRLDTSTSVRTALSISAHATPFADGTYTEVDPSLSADAAGIWFLINTISAGDTNTSTLLEFATGSGGAEVHWASVQVGYTGNTQAYFVPGFIAAGTRVAVRLRSAVSAQGTGNFFVNFLSATKSVDVGAPVTMGHNTATAAGVSLTAPGSLNTKGAWTEIEDSTPAAFGALLVNLAAGGDTTMNATGVLVDIGIGAASAETVLIADIYVQGSTSESLVLRSPVTYGVDIPAGSRLSARWARASATNSSLDCFLVGA
jgi:hypothetical protein